MNDRQTRPPDLCPSGSQPQSWPPRSSHSKTLPKVPSPMISIMRTQVVFAALVAAIVIVAVVTRLQLLLLVLSVLIVAAVIIAVPLHSSPSVILNGVVRISLPLSIAVVVRHLRGFVRIVGSVTVSVVVAPFLVYLTIVVRRHVVVDMKLSCMLTANTIGGNSIIRTS
ncbi:hypothetical protein HWI79_2977 [Cryptosporidium felis]|nr:hypothetical protein HWI79_2977 [Cryptosporidium felis]